MILSGHPAREDVYTIFSQHVSQIHAKIRDLKDMENALTRLNAKCENGTLNECPVIDELMCQATY